MRDRTRKHARRSAAKVRQLAERDDGRYQRLTRARRKARLEQLDVRPDTPGGGEGDDRNFACTVAPWRC